MLQSLDLTIPCALVNTIAAFVCLFLMQALTGDCGFRTKMARIKLLHRLSFIGLAAALFYNAGVTIDDDTAPRLVDFLVQALSLPVIAFSAWRHHIGAAANKPVFGMGKALRPVPNPVPQDSFPAAGVGRASCDIQWPAAERGQQSEKIR